MRCLSAPTEPVLGFVGAHSVVEQRLFIARRELPATYAPSTGYEACYPADTLWLDTKYPYITMQSYFGNGSQLPIHKEAGTRGAGYSAQSRDCIDCRTRGTAVKPSYWP